MSSRETDPLLPHSEPSPEISTHGFFRHKNSNEVKYDNRTINVDDYINEVDDARDEDNDSRVTPSTSTKSALSTIVSIFTFVVLGAFLFTLIRPEDGNVLPLPFRPNKSIQERVNKILDGTPLFDGHNDLAIAIRGLYLNKIHGNDFSKKFEHGTLPYHVDIPRLRSGKVGGTFWSAFVVCPVKDEDDYSDQSYAKAVKQTLQQIDLVRRVQAQFPDVFIPATTPFDQALAAFHDTKAIISPVSIEGLHQIPQTAPFSTLRLYYALGVRAATLTWNCHNAFADAALTFNGTASAVAPYYRGGLTPLGRNVIKEMNRLGMLVDISHTSYWTQKAVLSNNTSASPVIFTHSSAFTLCQHPRNVRDDILELVRETGSLVMVNFSPDFISCFPPPDPLELPKTDPDNKTLQQVARHILYIGKKIGFDHVGFGSDFDGIEETPAGLDGVDRYPDLVAELLKMGVSDENASKVVGGNLVRVWKAADAVAKKMQADGVQEMEDDIQFWSAEDCSVEFC